MSDYIGNEGDGYSMFSKYEVSQEGLFTDTVPIAYYIKNDLNGKIPSTYKDFQGRVNLVNGSIPSSIPTSIPSTQVPNSNNNNSYPWIYTQRKKSSGLSTGGILAIIIPTVVVLIIVAILSMMSSNKKAPVQQPLESINSMNNTNL